MKKYGATKEGSTKKLLGASQAMTTNDYRDWLLKNICPAS